VELPVKHLAERILKLVNGKSKLVFQALPVDDPMQRCPDITLARKMLNWEPKVALDQGLARTIAYFDGLLKSNKEVSRVGR
jgi:UDP-glucuronate decarboxylase